jgi:hypothetical protein
VIPGLSHFLTGSQTPVTLSALEQLHKLKNPMVLPGNRARDFSAFSRIVPQPTMLPRAPVNISLKEGIGQFLMVFLAES